MNESCKQDNIVIKASSDMIWHVPVLLFPGLDQKFPHQLREYNFDVSNFAWNKSNVSNESSIQL